MAAVCIRQVQKEGSAHSRPKQRPHARRRGVPRGGTGHGHGHRLPHDRGPMSRARCVRISGRVGTVVAGAGAGYAVLKGGTFADLTPIVSIVASGAVESAWGSSTSRGGRGGWRWRHAS